MVKRVDYLEKVRPFIGLDIVKGFMVTGFMVTDPSVTMALMVTGPAL